jgi:hypothetical protein
MPPRRRSIGAPPARGAGAPLSSSGSNRAARRWPKASSVDSQGLTQQEAHWRERQREAKKSKKPKTPKGATVAVLPPREPATRPVRAKEGDSNQQGAQVQAAVGSSTRPAGGGQPSQPGVPPGQQPGRRKRKKAKKDSRKEARQLGTAIGNLESSIGATGKLQGQAAVARQGQPQQPEEQAGRAFTGTGAAAAAVAPPVVRYLKGRPIAAPKPKRALPPPLGGGAAAAAAGGGGESGGGGAAEGAAGAGEQDEQAAKASRKAAKRARKAELRAAQKAEKRRKLRAHLSERGGSATVSTPTVASTHPFVVDNPNDHAETPFEAYRDIEPFLFQLALRRFRTTKQKLAIYDPYYCEGSVVRNLARLGCENVYNRNEDCYAAMALGEQGVGRPGGVPPHEVLLTNPPYSAEHVERLVRWASSGAQASRPFLALMPDFYANRPWFRQLRESTQHRWLFLGPKDKPYVFTAPTYAADGKQALLSNKKDGTNFVPSQAKFQTFTCNSFQCVWYLRLGAPGCGEGGATDGATEQMLTWWRKKFGRAGQCDVADTVEALPQLMQIMCERREHKWRKKREREARKQQQQQQQQ